MTDKRLFSLLICLAFCLLLINCTSLTTGQPTKTNPVLLISIDGFMPEFLERNETPNFDRLIRSGVYSDGLIPVFPTKTFPTHYSIVTGLYPENHGVIANSFYDYELNAHFSYGSPEGGPEDDLWWGGEPIWVTVEKQSKTAATMFWPGSDSKIDGVRPTRYKDYDGSVPDIARIDTVMSWLDPGGSIQADFATLYFSELDSRGHRYGPNSPEVDEAVLLADEWIGYLLESMDHTGLADILNVIIVSDHGMAELSENKVIFLDEIIEMNDVDVIDWTPVAMLRPRESKKDVIYNLLKENEENYSVYLKGDMPEYYHFSNHYRIPEILMIADISYTITTRSHFEERGLSRGNHGYDHRAPEMQALFLAAGPAFLENKRTGPVDSIHIYELMSYILGVAPAENDGSLDSIRHILR